MTAQQLGPEWNISPEGLNVLNRKKDNNNSDIFKIALDHDLKDIGNPILAQEIPKNRLTKVVLQIQKIRNVAAPKANENSQAAPRMLKMALTDGTSYIQAIETSTIPAINRDKTPPGAKLLINNARIVSGFLLLDKNNCSLLGGKVSHLYEKWEVSKSVQNHSRQATSSEGAPPWVNFGVKITSSDDSQFKSLESKNKDPSKEATEFDQQRKDAIAEASTGAVRKTFGGGAKQVTVTTSAPTHSFGGKQPANSDYREKNNRSFKSKVNPKLEAEDDSGYGKLEKPSERVLLSDFFDDILPTKTDNQAQSPKPTTNQTYNYNNKPQFIKDRGYSSGSSSAYNTNERNKYGNSYQSNQYGNSHNHFNHPGHENKSSGFVENYKSKQTRSDYNSFETKRSRDSYTSNRYNSNTGNGTGTSIVTKPVNPPEPEQNQNAVDNVSNRLNRVSLNNQFASRSLKQHLNIGTISKSNNNNPDVKTSSGDQAWKIGDDCLAKYWEDGKMYNATVTAVTDKTCVVQFAGYGNIEEVLKSDCAPGRGQGFKPGNQNARPYSGFQDTHRNTRTYSRRQ